LARASWKDSSLWGGIAPVDGWKKTSETEDGLSICYTNIAEPRCPGANAGIMLMEIDTLQEMKTTTPGGAVVIRMTESGYEVEASLDPTG
jgi:hypothetical protein